MGWRRVVAWGLGVLLALATAGLALYAQRVLPQVDGELEAPGLRAAVRVERDDDGIPTLRAASMRDAVYALGVVHAQDRLWQLETHRRIGAGELAEAFGAGALDNDRFLRALGVRRAAEAQWAALKGPSRELLQAYADGINSMQRSLRARPPEFLVLGLQPRAWTPVDSLAWAIMMSWDLGGNWSSELLRLQLAQRLPVQRIAELMPATSGATLPPTIDYPALYRTLGLDAAQRQAFGRLPALAPPSGVEGIGSNNWVVAGTHTVTGKPMLANDPHLKLGAPALWYLVRIEVPGLKLAGASIPGLPGVMLGQNEHVAWGFTNTAPDVQDLYLERIDPANPGLYQTPEGWAKFGSRSEVIRVRGGADVTITVRSTRHGPVISDAGPGAEVLSARGRPGYVLAMRWTALDADVDPIMAWLGMQRAQSLPQFVQAAEGWAGAMQNMAVADRDGRIGYIAPGRVPLRGPGHDLHGLAPAPGWDARYDWQGWVPADRTPRAFDPPRGWLATANQRIVDDDYPYFLTAEWAPPYRHRRIEQLLAARPRHALDDLAAQQADVTSLAVAALRPWWLSAQSRHPLQADLQPYLLAFDGHMGADEVAPLVFWAWSRQLTLAIFGDEIGLPLLERSLATRNWREALEGVVARNDAWWCDDKRTPAVETCAQMNDLAMGRAIEELRERFGAEVEGWRWGRAHEARAEHRPFSNVPVLSDLFELRVPVGGDTYTVNAARVSMRPDRSGHGLYRDEHGPSLRVVYDLEEPSRSRVMISSGQSGIVLSPRYRSFVQPWAEARSVPLWPLQPPTDTLQLNPAAAAAPSGG